jgi:hypothetical protein
MLFFDKAIERPNITLKTDATSTSFPVVMAWVELKIRSLLDYGHAHPYRELS